MHAELIERKFYLHLPCPYRDDARSKMWDRHMTSAECEGMGETPEANNLSAFGCQMEAANSLHSPCFANWRVSSKRDRPPNPPVKIRRICINLRNNLWQKSGVGMSIPWGRPCPFAYTLSVCPFSPWPSPVQFHFKLHLCAESQTHVETDLGQYC